MKSRRMIIIIAILGIVATAVVLFAVFTFQERYRSDSVDDTEETTRPVTGPPSSTDILDDGTEGYEPEEEPLKDEEDDFSDMGDIEPVEITGADCDNKCEDFNETEEDFMYCLEICGLADSEKSDDCEKLEGITQDYCWKSQAVENSDLKLCDKITDAGVKKTCKNRVAEDIFEPGSSLD